MNFKWLHHLEGVINLFKASCISDGLDYITACFGCHGYTARDKYRLIVFKFSIPHLGLANLQIQSTSTSNLNHESKVGGYPAE